MLFCLSVCLSVTTLQVTVFVPITWFFENMFFRTMEKKFFFPFFEIFIFDVFMAFYHFFQSFFLFVFVLATSHRLTFSGAQTSSIIQPYTSTLPPAGRHTRSKFEASTCNIVTDAIRIDFAKLSTPSWSHKSIASIFFCFFLKQRKSNWCPCWGGGSIVSANIPIQ